jgi:hypothetical protein
MTRGVLNIGHAAILKIFLISNFEEEDRTRFAIL